MKASIINWKCKKCDKDCANYLSQTKRKGQGQFCSRSCAASYQLIGNKFNQGRVQTSLEKEKRHLAMLGKNRGPKSQDTKNKISQSLIGKKISSEALKKRLGRTPWNKGLKGFRAAEDSNLWKGGITPLNRALRQTTEYKGWRKAVYERDNYTCVWCGIRQSKGNQVFLHADHVKPFAYFPDLRLDINNGRTLCQQCHKSTPTWGVGATKLYGKRLTVT